MAGVEMTDARITADARSAAASNQDARIDLTWQFYAALHNLELAAMFDALSPGIELHHTEPAPWGGSHHGHPGVRRFLERLVLCVDARFAVTSVSAADTGSMIVTGSLRGQVRATGVPFDAAFTHIWTTSGGRLTRLDASLDVEPFARALSMARLPTLTATTPTAPPSRERRTPRRTPRRSGGSPERSSAGRRRAHRPSQIDVAAALRLPS